ncbi:MAG: HAD-IA family hydrolase, partial [Thermoguttaceae bacterium]|nr:HAD-IA family hydrolase [Thermoguttaceae bacterium]
MNAQTSNKANYRGFVEAVAFDMDGLMFDTEAVYQKSADILLGRRGHEYTDELREDIMGRPPEYCFKRMVEYCSLNEDWRDLQRESNEIFIRLLGDGYATTPGLLELLDELERREIPRCVCTSSAPMLAREVLKKHDVYKRFAFILTSEDIVNGKPNPEIYQKAAARFGLPIEKMLTLEDSENGRLAALAAGS